MTVATVFIEVGMSERITIEFEAEARTITGQAFGKNVPFLTPLRGYFTYESETPDQNPADPMRGSFLLSGTWDFRAEILDQVITGSGRATASTNLFGSPTLSLNDGGNRAGRGMMSINGTPQLDLEFGFSISGATKDLPTDRLPKIFTFDPPPNGAPHTFVLRDDSGQINFRFVSFQQVTTKIRSIIVRGNEVELVWSSVRGKRYALAFSPDLNSWTMINDHLIGDSPLTAVFDQRSEEPPRKGFYRILERSSGAN